MKQLYSLLTLLIVCLLTGVSTQAQGIYQLWGTTDAGGTDDIGTLYTTKYDGTGHTIKKTFTYTNPGKASGYNGAVVYNNKLYCMLAKGGVLDGGMIMEYDPANNTYLKKANLADIGFEGEADNSLIILNNKMYAANADKLLEFNPATSALTLEHQFVNATGITPIGNLTAFNNKLYGITREGGTNNEGVIYEYDPATNIYTKKKDLSEAVTGTFFHSSFSVYDNKLWAVTYSYQNMAGQSDVISYDPATNIFTRKVALSTINTSSAQGEITWYNGKGYGVTSLGGFSNEGVAFEYNPVNNTLLSKAAIGLSSGINCGPFVVYGAKLYCQSRDGGIADAGQVSAYNPVTENFEAKVVFDEASGRDPSQGVLAVYNDKLYGFTTNGGAYGRGSLYEYTVAPIKFTKKIDFGGPELARPDGKMVYYNNKIYGTTFEGGDYGEGGIYEYNPATGAYVIKIHLKSSEGKFTDFGNLMVYNNKFYGVTTRGGATDDGVIFEYDPATNIYTKRYDFKATTGRAPHAPLVEYGGKLYGTCSDGSTNGMGNIFQYDPVTYTYTQKVIFNATWGGFPQGELLLHNGKLYGTATSEGAHDKGTLFEYNPLANAFNKLADFDGVVTGAGPLGKLTLYKNKFYGICGYDDYLVGSIFCYDLANSTLTKKVELSTYPTGKFPKAELTLLNNKLYGTTQLGGDYMFGGTMFEYDPETETHTQRVKFTGANGKFPNRGVLQPIPAPVAPGSPGSCINTSTVNIQAGNSNQWIPFTDNQGRAVAEINANGNILGNVSVRYFVNDVDVRKDGKGTFYLDRNLTFTVDNQPTTLVSIRLYVSKSEFETLKATAGSGVTVPADIAIFHNNDFCASDVNGKADKIATAMQPWGTDYVYIAHVPSFSSFYFATSTAVALPIHIESFTGKAEDNGNLLSWKASCTNAVEFTVERSSDGIHFNAIGSVSATQQDCAHPFNFNDVNYQAGKNYYRLTMNEQGNITYSKILLLDRNSGNTTVIKVLPNPVTGPVAQVQITSPQAGTVQLYVTNMEGKNLLSRKQAINVGTQLIPLSVAALPAGLYCVRFYDGHNWQSTRFIKQ
jgi:uncharacterized repeat protein (TIGR03803 family)